jgi:hypothetical protein
MTHIQRAFLILVCAGSLAACSNMSEREQRTVEGGAIGAGVGAVGVAVLGGPALVGAGVGAVGGALIGNQTGR